MNAATNAGFAFNHLADTYDDHFTHSLTGRAQRSAVWSIAAPLLRNHAHILELNCGTGEDALFFAQRGHTVTATDASTGMVRQAQQKFAHRDLPVTLHHLSIESIASLSPGSFNALFSNFSGLNCVADLAAAANALAGLVPAGAPAVFVISTRFCLWETLWYLFRLQPRKAFRRWPGRTTARLAGTPIDVYYPRVHQIRRALQPHFALSSIHGIGIAVPPSYVEPSIATRPRWVHALTRIDALLNRLPGFRVLGDHMLLHLVRTNSQP